jgi:uncharacterized protein YndB with AHSA1/START domain
MFDPDTMGEIIDGHTLRFVRTVKHSCERVWRALTDDTELATWMRYPVRFEPRADGRVCFFDERNRIVGKVFIFDPPRTLAYSFADVRLPDHVLAAERRWGVRWDLEPDGNGCRITFIQRHLPGAVLWGLGEGWHLFLDSLQAYLSGNLDAVAADQTRIQESGDTSGLSRYRLHVGNQLAAWAQQAAVDGRNAIGASDPAAVLTAIDRLELATRQLHRIAQQENARPNYSLPDAAPNTL